MFASYSKFSKDDLMWSVDRNMSSR